MDKKKIIWAILFVFIAGASIWAVISQSQGFSLEMFGEYIKEANASWLIIGVFSALGFLVFEGFAIRSIIAGLGYPRKIRKNMLYASADLYFSAITPSATGGQPASAYFMVKDGIPAAVVTVALLINLIMYTAAIIVIGIVSIIICPEVFFGFSALSRVLIITGYVIMLFLGVIFMLLLFHKKMLENICNKILKLLDKCKLIRNRKKKKEKLTKTMDDFRQCASMVSGQRGMLWKAFGYNFLQRLSQLLVTVFVYLATGGIIANVNELFVMQSFVAIGSNCVPIPGAMGVADYLMIDGFGSIMSETAATNLELLSRSMSFYILIIISGITVVLGMIFRKIKRRNL